MVSWEEAEKLDYRALAKAGGRRGEFALKQRRIHIKLRTPGFLQFAELLKHQEYCGCSVAQPHPPSVDWFAHPTPPPPDPQAPQYTSKLADSWMTWDTEKSIKLPTLANRSQQPQGVTSQKRVHETKLPPV